MLFSCRGGCGIMSNSRSYSWTCTVVPSNTCCSATMVLLWLKLLFTILKAIVPIAAVTLCFPYWRQRTVSCFTTTCWAWYLLHPPVCLSFLPSITSGWLNLFRIHTMMMMMQLSSLTLSHGTPIHITDDLDNMDFYIWYVETRTRNRTGGCPDITNDDELRFLFKASKHPIRELD